jgi:tetratricopeptide (TPR) repeat protein
MIVLQGKIIKVFVNRPDLRLLEEQICINKAEVNCYSCKSEGDCAFLFGAINYGLEDYEAAIKQLEDAFVHFRGIGHHWNAITSLELLGFAYERAGKPHQAKLEFDKALTILTQTYSRLHKFDYSNDAATLKKELEYCRDHPVIVQPTTTTKKAAHANTRKDRLHLPWFREYSRVQAGPNGPIWVEPVKDTSTDITTIFLNGKPYTLHTIIKQSAGDDYINLIDSKEYGWAAVSGDSMAAAKPVPIREEDFVLFYKSNGAADQSIVIASYQEENGAGLGYKVKRYIQSDQNLVSETDPAGKYNAVPLTKDTAIMGTVVAVAKPLDEI